MTADEREIISKLLPYMCSIPERVQALVARVVALRNAFAGQEIDLDGHIDLIKADLAALEQDARNLAQAVIMVQRLLEEAAADGDE